MLDTIRHPPPRPETAMRRAVALLALVLPLAACGTTGSSNEAPVAANSATVKPAYTVQEPSSPPATTAATSPAAPRVAKVGQTFTYADGLAVTVTGLKAFKIGAYAAGGKAGGTGVLFSITLTNGTQQPFDAALTTVDLAYGDTGEQAEQVYDSDQGLGLGFTGKVQPGRKVTAKFGFAVPAANMNDLQFEVKPGFLDHDSAPFVGGL